MPRYRVKTKERQLFVKAKLSHNEKLKEREMNMFSEKNIRGFLNVKSIKKKSVEYTGAIGISLYERLESTVSKYDFFFMIEQVVELVRRMQTDTLSLKSIVLDLHSVFINETTKELWFVYLPLEGVQNRGDIQGFVEDIVYYAIPVKNSDANYLSEFIYFLKQMGEFNADQIENYIRKIDESIIRVIKKGGTGQSDYVADSRGSDDTYRRKKTARETVPWDENDRAGSTESERGVRTKYLDSENGDQKCFPALYQRKTKEYIDIDKTVFLLGREGGGADYNVENDKVGRRHATIFTEDEQYFVMDLGSRNKTFINDRELFPQQKRELLDGDWLRLADEEFVFYIW